MAMCEQCKGKGFVRDGTQYGSPDLCPYCKGTGQGRAPKLDPREPEGVVMMAPEQEPWKPGDEAILTCSGYLLSHESVWLIKKFDERLWYIGATPGCSVQDSYFALFGEKHFRRPSPKPSVKIHLLPHSRWMHDWSWAFPMRKPAVVMADDPFDKSEASDAARVNATWWFNSDLLPPEELKAGLCETRGPSILKELYPAWRAGLFPKEAEPSIASTVEGIVAWQQHDPNNRRIYIDAWQGIVCVKATMLIDGAIEPDPVTVKVKFLTPDSAENARAKISSAIGCGPDAEVTYSHNPCLTEGKYRMEVGA